MIAWLVPVSMFWLVAALYLGGFDLEIEGGGGVQQFLGLILSFVLFVVVFRVLGMALGGALGASLGGIVFPSILSVALLPVITRVGFRPLGVKITKGHAAH
jgi:hypothetical protein